MNVRFRSSQLRRCYEQIDLAQRTWGTVVGERYTTRITQIFSASSISDLHALRSLRLHPLTGERRGQYAMTLQAQWRLIISLVDDDTTMIEEVSNHYD